MVVAVFLGISFGIGGGLLTEAVDGTIRGTRDICNVMGAPPIAAIPKIQTAADIGQMKRHRIITITAVAISIAAVVAYVQLQRFGAA